MHGPVPAHPPHRPPAQGTVILLRVVFVATAVLSLGLLAWVPMLRAAIVQRGQLGWWLFGGDLVAVIGACVLITSYAETDWRTNVGVGLLLMQIAAAVAYYLVVDTRARRTAAPGAGHVPAAYPGLAGLPGTPPLAGIPGSPPLAQPYGPPQPPAPGAFHSRETQPYQGPRPANPYAVTETRLPPPPAPGHHPAPAPYLPAPAPQERPQPQRIDRVRAELDELSDYLRKEEGR
ncbi:hypothetical protein ACWCXK_30800 [Streptomyces sp. NPDC001739]|uniref:hypothetical protein n=1 Tax=Streptomyces sp. NPDC001657 TaxID=3154522 RepID=UPI003330E640